VVIHASTHGYAMELTAGTTDLARFRALVKEAAGTASASAVPVLWQALQLWRGPALDNVPVGPSVETVVAQLERERDAVLLQYAQASMRAGQPERAVEAVLPLVDDRPLDEVAHAVLIEALAANGRQAEALAT
jgi:DNA-binding SARP family transcriptional activator